jgi:hypothetical protein
MYGMERFSVSRQGRAGGRLDECTAGERFAWTHALSSYRLDGRSIREGHPVDRMPGPSASEQTRKVVGLALTRRGAVPTRITSRATPDSITSRHAAGKPGMLDRIRAAQTPLSRIVRNFGQLLTPRQLQQVIVQPLVTAL